MVCSGVYRSGIEGNPTVFYRLMPGSTAQTNKFHTFYLQQRSDNGFTWADIKVNHPLDYETIKEYNLTIRVEVSGESLCLWLWYTVWYGIWYYVLSPDKRLAAWQMVPIDKWRQSYTCLLYTSRCV